MLSENLEQNPEVSQNIDTEVESSVSVKFGVLTSLGNIELAFLANDSSHNINTDPDLDLLHSAQLLGRAESIICLLEDWLGIDLDFSPIFSLDTDINRIKVKLTFLNSNKDETNAELSLPMGIIKCLMPPEPELSSLMIWSEVPCEVSLASVDVSIQQLEKLSKGSMLLIPESFELFWRCYVRLSADPLSVFSAEVDVPQQRFIFDYYDAKNRNDVSNDVQYSSENKEIEVLFKTSLLISVDKLLGWAEKPVFSLGQIIARFSVRLKNSQTCFAEGDLVSIGNGYGVLLRSMRSEIV